MRKIRKTIAKLLVVALLFPLLACAGPGVLTAWAADFLANTVPSQVYLNLNFQQSVAGNAYIGWTITADDHYTGMVTQYGDLYYISGAAAYNNSYTTRDGDAYSGYFSSNDLAKWTLLTAPVDADVWSGGESMSVNIPLDYKVVTTSGRTVSRGGGSLVTNADLFYLIPPMPVEETTYSDYTVVANDTLAKIARKYGVTADKIRAANEGYFNDLAVRNEVAGTNVAIEKDVVINIPTTKVNGVNYPVRAGDTLWGIAFNYYGTMSDEKVIEIMNANKELFRNSKGVLEAGSILYLPPRGIRNPVTTTHIDQAVGVYRVKLDDTVTDINRKYYGASANALGKIYEANKERITKVGNSYMIYEQQWLVVIN